ncbi:hypothetical protein D3C81_1743720 [compost metagenome]
MAIIIGAGNPKIRLRILRVRVFQIICSVTLDWNKISKYFNPTHGLDNMPS